MSEGRLAGKVAITTGGSRGLGQYCAVGYGREGARVVVAARTEVEKDPNLPGTIHETVQLVEEAGGEAMAVVCNVADTDSINAMVNAVLEKWGQIDVLMNNAAVQPPGGISRRSTTPRRSPTARACRWRAAPSSLWRSSIRWRACRRSSGIG